MTLFCDSCGSRRGTVKVSCFLVALLLTMARPPAWAHSIPRNTMTEPDATVSISEDTILSVPSRTPPIECACFSCWRGNIRRTAEWGKAVQRTGRAYPRWNGMGGLRSAGILQMACYRRFRYNAFHLVAKAGTEKIKDPLMVYVPCNGCTACCHGPVMLHPALGDNPMRFDTEWTEYGYKLLQNSDGSCIYVGPKGCTIWPETPALCRAFDCREYVRSGVYKFDPLGDEKVFAAGERLLAAHDPRLT